MSFGRSRSGRVRSSSVLAGRNHDQARSTLRILGPAVLGVGLIFVAVGMISFFSSIGSFQPPQYFWCCFVGLPITVVGIGMTKFAFMGTVARFAAAELAPVGKDTINYMATGTREAVRTVTSAIKEGLSEPTSNESTPCPGCDTMNDGHAKFCDECGNALAATKSCTGCSSENDADARFCDNCGTAL